jgi:predicted PurR-regulated permease PerM
MSEDLNNTTAVTNFIILPSRTMLIVCTTMTILSFFGILFLVVVVALIVSRAVQLAVKYEQIKNNAQDKVQDLVESEEWQNFQDHLLKATEQTLTNAPNKLAKKEVAKVPGVKKEEKLRRGFSNPKRDPVPYHYYY